MDEMDEVSLLNFHGKKFIQEIRVAKNGHPLAMNIHWHHGLQ
jgi:hypothetical protein